MVGSQFRNSEMRLHVASHVHSSVRAVRFPSASTLYTLQIGSSMEANDSKNASRNVVNHPESMPMLRSFSSRPKLTKPQGHRGPKPYSQYAISPSECASRSTNQHGYCWPGSP